MGLTNNKILTANKEVEVPWEICDDVKIAKQYIENIGYPTFTFVDVKIKNPRTKKIYFYVPPDKLPLRL